MQIAGKSRRKTALLNRIVLLFAILAGIAALQGCAGSSNPNYPAPTTQNPAPGVSLQSIKITPATPFIGIVENRQLFAT